MGAVDSGISRTLDIPGFIAKTRECSNLSVGVALKVWFSYGQYMKMTRDEQVGEMWDQWDNFVIFASFGKLADTFKVR